MKKLYILLSFICLFFAATAQDYSKDIPLMVIIPGQTDGLPEGSQAYLTNKLTQVATARGLAVGSDYSPFFIAPKLLLSSKDILGGAKQSVVLNIEMTLYIGDYAEQKIFSTTTLNLKGVGINETKAYNAAIRSLSPQNKTLQEFLTEGKSKIIAWYNAQCDNLMKEADMLALQKQYQHALYVLTTIPNACACYDKALKATARIWQQYIDYTCDMSIAKAKTIWAANQNIDGANEAGAYLSEIYPDAKCYGEAQKLITEIKSRMKEDWLFVQKVYQDGVDLESQRINAAREVGIAFGKGQQPSTTNIAWIR